MSYSGVWDRKSASAVNVVEPSNRSLSKDLETVEQRKKSENLSSDANESLEQHEQRIVELAKPRKPFPGGPARLNQKKKTVAFGRTVNISQCIEGNRTDRGETKIERLMTRPINDEDKENAGQATSSKKVTARAQPLQKPVVSDGVDQPELIMKLQNTVDLLMEKVCKMEENQRGQAVVPARNDSPPRNRNHQPVDSQLSRAEMRILDDLEPMLESNIRFLQSVMDMCNRIGRKNNVESGYNRGYSAPPGDDPYSSPQNRNSVVTEQIFMQRRVEQPLSPNGTPYSTASLNFMRNRNILPSSNDNDAPISMYHHVQNAPAMRSHPHPMPPVSSFRRTTNSLSQEPTHSVNYEYDVEELDDENDERAAGSVVYAEPGYAGRSRPGDVRNNIDGIARRQEARKDRRRNHR